MSPSQALSLFANMAEKSSTPPRTSLDDEKDVKDEYHEAISSGHDEEQAFEDVEFRKKELKLIKKLDVFIAPVMFLLMLISYLDRG